MGAHLNDSQGPAGCHRDRHANIGIVSRKGHIGRVFAWYCQPQGPRGTLVLGGEIAGYIYRISCGDIQMLIFSPFHML